MPKADAQSGVPVRRGRRPRTRERLLAAAATAIARSGWDAVTTRQVAALADVNPGLVHYHFGSMDALRREAALHALFREVSGPTLALVEAPSIEAGLRACVAAVGELDPISESALVLYEAMLASTRDAELRAMLKHALDEFRGVLTTHIAREGGAHPEAGAMAIAAALDGALLHRLVDPELDVSRLAAPLVEALQLPAPTHTRPEQER